MSANSLTVYDNNKWMSSSHTQALSYEDNGYQTHIIGIGANGQNYKINYQQVVSFMSSFLKL